MTDKTSGILALICLGIAFIAGIFAPQYLFYHGDNEAAIQSLGIAIWTIGLISTLAALIFASVKAERGDNECGILSQP